MFDFLGRKKKADKPRILIIEDEPDLVQTLKDRLERNEYDIITAENGKAGLEMALREKPDVVLLDVNMPIMDGFAMLEALRKHPEGMNCAVIMITVHSQKQDITRAEACGINDYIVKPFNMEDLIEKIETVLKRRKES